MAPYLAEIVPTLERLGELTLDGETRRKLIGISPATIDRMLAPARKRYQLRARSQTKPGTLLKHQIPIRTFGDWDELRPGFIEVDLVSHEGGNARGDYAYTLDATDVCTAWTETEAVRNRAEKWVFAGLEKAKARFPFDIIGIDSDNGSEFINNHLFRYCTENKITFTRSRPYRKNDNCFVEQKNYSVVRRAVGYRRYDTPCELEALNELYAVLRLFTNYFEAIDEAGREDAQREQGTKNVRQGEDAVPPGAGFRHGARRSATGTEAGLRDAESGEAGTRDQPAAGSDRRARSIQGPRA